MPYWTGQSHNQGTVIRILSIDTPSNQEPTEKHGQYNVVIEVNGTLHRLEYTCDFSDEGGLSMQSITWKPSDSVLANRNTVDLQAVTTITDTVAQYHKTKSVKLPRVVQ